TNINEHCGSTHPQRLQERVCELGADVGLAFDGDADRLIAVDERGRLVDGDVIMAICAIHLQQVGKLAQDTLVTTVMSNVGLDIAMKQHGIRVEKTDVGDRYVLERMREKGYMLGGEQSGHMIFLAHQTTGDGMLTGVELLSILTETGRSLGNLAQCMQALPQALLGAKVPESHKMTFREDAEIARAVDLLEKKYAESGRVLIRPSGTEPLVRVMIEGPDLRMIEQDAFELAQLIETRMA
ncbi:MAG: phosphoglucosamine mutase, partial [Clostridia bacterium]